MFWEVGGNQSTQINPTQTLGEAPHSVTRDQDETRDAGTVGWQFYPLTTLLLLLKIKYTYWKLYS